MMSNPRAATCATALLLLAIVLVCVIAKYPPVVFIALGLAVVGVIWWNFYLMVKGVSP